MTLVVGPDKSGGLEVLAGFQGPTERNATIRMKMEINNVSSAGEIKALAIQLNKNAFGLSPASQQVVCNPNHVSTVTSSGAVRESASSSGHQEYANR
jgi:AP-1 complex subunit beta-1